MMSKKNLGDVEFSIDNLVNGINDAGFDINDFKNDIDNLELDFSNLEDDINNLENRSDFRAIIGCNNTALVFFHLHFS